MSRDSTGSKRKTLAELAEEARREPITLKDRVIGAVAALAFAGLGVAMWLWPAILSFESDGPSGRGRRKLAFWLEILWSRLSA